MSGGGLDPPLEMMVHVWGGSGPPPRDDGVCNRSVTVDILPQFLQFQLIFYTFSGNGSKYEGKYLFFMCLVMFSVAF